MATKEGENMCFVLFCYFWLRFTKCVIPAKFQIPVPHNKEVRPFFTKSVDFKHVSMATKEGENMCFVLICYFWLRFTKYVIPAKFQIPVPQNNRVRPFFTKSVDFKHVSMATKESENMCFVYFAIFGYALPNVSYLQNFRFQFLIIRKLDPFFTKSVDFKHVSMATEERRNKSFVLFCYFWLGFTKCIIPAKFQIPVPHNNRVRPIFYQICGF